MRQEGRYTPWAGSEADSVDFGQAAQPEVERTYRPVKRISIRVTVPGGSQAHGVPTDGPQVPLLSEGSLGQPWHVLTAPSPAEVMQNFSSRPEVQHRAMKRLLRLPEDQLGRDARPQLWPPGQTLHQESPGPHCCAPGWCFLTPEARASSCKAPRRSHPLRVLPVPPLFRGREVGERVASFT